jgi:hypothetical protein
MNPSTAPLTSNYEQDTVKLSLSIGLCTFVYGKRNQLCEEKQSLRPFQRSLCSFRQTRSLYSTNYVNR